MRLHFGLADPSVVAVRLENRNGRNAKIDVNVFRDWCSCNRCTKVNDQGHGTLANSKSRKSMSRFHTQRRLICFEGFVFLHQDVYFLAKLRCKYRDCFDACRR